MTESERKNLDLARKTLLQHDDSTALTYYAEVFKANSDNAEAAYYTYIAEYHSTSLSDIGKKKDAFLSASAALPVAAENIAEADESLENKLLITANALGRYLALLELVVKARIGEPSQRIQVLGITLYETGDAIEKAYDSDRVAMEVAVKSWKEAVKLHQKFYAYTYGGRDVNEYVAKIQKIEPDYVMPKKAGCVSLG